MVKIRLQNSVKLRKSRRKIAQYGTNGGKFKKKLSLKIQPKIIKR